MCNHMFTTRTIYGLPVKVPCGSCVTCRRSNMTFMSHRIQSDVSALDRKGIGSSFVTLTIESNNPKLQRSDLQKFFKRLRKNCPDFPFSYLAIGDYGEQTFRPHYHALMLGFPPEAESFINQNWKLGLTDVKPIVSGNINYVVRYMSAQTKSIKEQFVKHGLEEPFSLCSRNLGHTLFDIIEDGYYTFKGKRYKVPSYYQAKFNVHPQPADLSRFIEPAKRLKFKDVQSYLNYKAYVSELNATKLAQNRLKPYQGIKHTLDNIPLSVVYSQVNIPDDIF